MSWVSTKSREDQFALALDHAYNNATGESRQQMAKVLGLQGVDIRDINAWNSKVMEMLESRAPDTIPHIANSVSIGRDVILSPGYVSLGKRVYRLQFPQQESLDTQSAKGLTIASKARFDGVLTWQFDESLTDIQWFRFPDGHEEQIDMLGALGRFTALSDYGDVPAHQESPRLLRLPYADGQTSLYIALMNADWINDSLNQQNWDKWKSQMRKRRIMVCLPAFQVTYKAEVLKLLHLAPIGITGQERQAYSLTELEHTASIGVSGKGARPLPKTAQHYLPDFRPEGPFLFAVQDDRTGLILFMGWVADPTEGLSS